MDSSDFGFLSCSYFSLSLVCCDRFYTLILTFIHNGQHHLKNSFFKKKSGGLEFWKYSVNDSLSILAKDGEFWA